MTANSIEESEALTLDFTKLAKGVEVPGVQPCAAHAHADFCRLPIATWAVMWA